ncbi:MAG: alanine--tRNA ligase, partial [Planctomycetaceae bacterium]|jgi:alanyl-tRNA synthetase|nr:alanine--tRNA ligase [Planctomycetaceae bacterium]
MKANELREKYLSFFETKGCVRKSSDVLAPRWDPSVLFTPAGMNQFKDHFLGRCKLEFTRATTCQKCLRTGDIDNVGRTAYHHTFFEMLGNFSFGDYFKREAILWAWEFLTDKKWLAIDPSKLSVTVYKDDHEAAQIWLNEIKLPESKIQYLEEDENFWPASAPSLGPDGVCGPCSEIYHDTPVGAVEIWNLVFTQFNRVGNPPNNLRPLPSKNIDTGMGLERCAAVLQGVDTNYHIDILLPLVETAAELLKQKYEPANNNGRRFRRIADHIRACVFAIHENVYPGNKEEKYVIRRLLRRALLDGRQIGCKDAFLYQLVPTVADLMRSPYPELSETSERVAGVIRAEEEHFIETVDSGLERIERVFDEMRKHDRKQVTGEEIFDMYQTFGFPPELFETMAAERNFGFDWNGFKREMERHGELSGSGERGLLFKNDPLEGIKKTQHKSEFLGYDQLEFESSRVVAILSDGKLVDSELTPDLSRAIQIVLDNTTFYGEKGGQVGDCGWLTGEGVKFKVISTQIDGDLIVHVGNLVEGTIKLGDCLFVKVDKENRNAVARAHSATHILHYVLRRELGNHAEQRGSKVDNDFLRFDFTHHQAVDKKTLQKIELEVNRLILDSDSVICRQTSVSEAKKSGAMMLFGEKYPDEVRVVQIGESKELCGGTHVTNSSQVGFFRIMSEESVSSGTRRIVALTGMKAVERSLTDAAILQHLTSSFRIPAEEIPAKVDALTEQIKKLQKQIKDSNSSGKFSAKELIEGSELIDGVRIIVRKFDDQDVSTLRSLVDQVWRETGKDKQTAILFATLQEDKLTFVAGFSDALVKERNVSAIDWVKDIAAVTGGQGGGGKSQLAQAGGKDIKKLDEAFKAAKIWFENK